MEAVSRARQAARSRKRLQRRCGFVGVAASGVLAVVLLLRYSADSSPVETWQEATTTTSPAQGGVNQALQHLTIAEQLLQQHLQETLTAGSLLQKGETQDLLWQTSKIRGLLQEMEGPLAEPDDHWSRYNQQWLEQVVNKAPARRPKILGFVGVMSVTARKRQLMRDHWFPPNKQALTKWETDNNVVMRFVMGNFADPVQQREVEVEEAENGDIFRVFIQEHYDNLAYKILVYLKTVVTLYDADYILKVDDDEYVRPSAFPIAFSQWKSHAFDYLGCFFNPGDQQFFDQPSVSYYEPSRALWKNTFMYASGGAYAVSGRAAGYLAHLPVGALRVLGPGDDGSVGFWMQALNTTWALDRRMCSYDCRPEVFVVTNRCNGLCNVYQDIPRLHNDTQCSTPWDPLNPVPLIPAPNAEVDLRELNMGFKLRDNELGVVVDKTEVRELAKTLRPPAEPKPQR